MDVSTARRVAASRNALGLLNSHPSKEMPKANRTILWSLAVGLMSIVGCQTWNSSTGLPGLGKWQQERQVVKLAQNDPFPTPEQVGLK
jgi:hypothetical protein